jgi:hypothetical protein
MNCGAASSLSLSMTNKVSFCDGHPSSCGDGSDLINQIHWALLDLAISPALWFIVGLQRRALDGFKISVELHIERRGRSG